MVSVLANRSYHPVEGCLTDCYELAHLTELQLAVIMNLLIKNLGKPPWVEELRVTLEEQYGFSFMDASQPPEVIHWG